MSTEIGRRVASVGARRCMTVILTATLLVPAATGPRVRPVFGMPLVVTEANVAAVVALAGYQVSLFAKGNPAYRHPDSVVYDGAHVFVGFQSVTAKDGSDNKTSTVVEYTMQGQVVRTFGILGHNDGLRLNPISHLLWALSDEDGNPHLTTINPTSGATKLYRFPATPHGGGFDDLAFTHGMALIDASNPNLDKNGVNVFPALDKVTLRNDMGVLTPILMGNALATDMATRKKVPMNLIDPDSMTFDPQGNLVLDNQGGSSLVFISGVGSSFEGRLFMRPGRRAGRAGGARGPHPAWSRATAQAGSGPAAADHPAGGRPGWSARRDGSSAASADGRRGVPVVEPRGGEATPPGCSRAGWRRLRRPH